MPDERHPTLRLSSFLLATSPLYKIEQPKAAGAASDQHNNMLRTMPIYGTVRPSNFFTSESRKQRTFSGQGMDMSNEPPVWFDSCIGSDRAGCVSYPKYSDVDDSYIERFKKIHLMLPSERYDDHMAIKTGMANWRSQRRELFEYNKRKRIMERKHRGGIVGIDYPLREGTSLYKHDYERFQAQREKSENHAQGRLTHLADQRRASECITEPFGSAPAAERGSDCYGFQRKQIEKETHPFRFLDTFNRLYPVMIPTWDIERAKAIRSHDVRQKTFNILNFSDNSVDLKVKDL